MTRRFFQISLLLVLTTGITLAQSNASFAGTFTNPDIELTLTRQGGAYTGTVRFEGQSFPVQARPGNGSTLIGTYQYFGQPVPFQASLHGDVLTVASEGQQFQMRRKPQPPAPSPDGGASSGSGQIRNDGWGLAFQPPSRWTARQTPDGYLLGSNQHKGILLVLPNDATTVAEMEAGARQGIREADGTALLLDAATLTPFGDTGLEGRFSGTLQGDRADAHVIGLLSNRGSGVIVLAATTPEAFSEVHVAAARELARSVSFFTPPVPPIARQWKEKLTGCRLSHFSRYSSGSGGGYTTETAIDLCAQGVFRYGNQDETTFNTGDGSLTGGYSMGSSRGSGRWSVVGRQGHALLRLAFHDGRVWEYTLSTNDKSHTLLDGERYLRTCNPNDAVVEARPNCW